MEKREGVWILGVAREATRVDRKKKTKERAGDRREVGKKQRGEGIFGERNKLQAGGRE